MSAEHRRVTSTSDLERLIVVTFEALLRAGRLRPERQVHFEAGKWELWKAIETTSTGDVEKYFARILTGATLLSGRQLKRLGLQSIHGIISDRHPFVDAPNRLLEEFGLETVQTTRQFILRPVEAVVKQAKDRVLRERLRHLENETFVNPDIGIESGDVLAFFAQWFARGADSHTGAQIAVIAADGGLGKTWVTTHLERHLWERWHARSWPGIPLWIDSRIWKSLDDRPGHTFLDIIRTALIDRFLGPISDSDLIMTYLAEGLLYPIFDGFDELCTQRHTDFSPDEVVRQLSALVDQGDGRVLLTSRLNYWLEAVSAPRNSRFSIYQIRGFGKAQRRVYFKSELKSNAKVAQATRLMERIEKACYGSRRQPAPTQRLTGVPYILNLFVRILREGKGTNEQHTRYEDMMADPIRGILRFLCERERVRQNIRASADEQLDFFCYLAIGFAERFTVDDIELCASVQSSPALQDPAQRRLLRTHVLVERQSEGDYCIRFSLLRERLQALAVEEKWADPHYRTEIMKILADAFRQATLSEYLAERFVATDGSANPWTRRFRSVAEWLLTDSRAESREAISGLWQVAQTIMSFQGCNKRARTVGALKAFGTPDGDSFHRLFFSGSLRKFNFASITFNECAFRNVTFAACEFSDKTCFRKCRIEGDFNIHQDCVNPRDIAVDCDRESISPAGVIGLLRGGVADAVPLVDAEVVRAALMTVLRMFYESGQQRRVQEELLNRGPPLSPVLFRDIKESLLDENVIQRVADGRAILALTDEGASDCREYLETGGAFGGVAATLSALKSSGR